MLGRFVSKDDCWSLLDTRPSIRYKIQLDDVECQCALRLSLQPFFVHVHGDVAVAIVGPLRGESRVSRSRVRIPQFNGDRGVEGIEVGIPGHIVSRIDQNLGSIPGEAERREGGVHVSTHRKVPWRRLVVVGRHIPMRMGSRNVQPVCCMV